MKKWTENKTCHWTLYNSCSDVLQLGSYTRHVRRKSHRTSYPLLLPILIKIRMVRQSNWIKIHSVHFYLLNADRSTCRSKEETLNTSRTEESCPKFCSILFPIIICVLVFKAPATRSTLMGSKALTFGECPTFHSNLLSPQAGLRSEPAVTAAYSCWFLVSLTPRHENEINISPRNVRLSSKCNPLHREIHYIFSTQFYVYFLLL